MPWFRHPARSRSRSCCAIAPRSRRARSTASRRGSRSIPAPPTRSPCTHPSCASTGAKRAIAPSSRRGAAAAPAACVGEHGFEARDRPKLEAVVGLGAGGPIRAKLVRLKQIKLGDAAVADLVGELYVGDKGEFADPDASANLGAGVLSRFVVTFDYQGRRLYLEPVAGEPRDIYDRAGMAFRTGGDALRITAITPGGPAEHAGLTTEDRIVAIDGAAATSRPLWAWRESITRGKVGARYTLTVERAGTRRDVALVLVEQLP